MSNYALEKAFKKTLRFSMCVYYNFPEYWKAGTVDINLHSVNLQAQSIAIGRGKEGKSLNILF